MEINGEQVNETKTYAELGLSEAIMKAIGKKGYVQATPVQAGAIPYFMEWKDVIAKAPTGTGKTFAFGIPMVEHIDPACEDVQGRSRRSCGICASSRRGCAPSASTAGPPSTSRSTP